MTPSIIDAGDDSGRRRVSLVTAKYHGNVHILRPTLFLKSQMTVLRDKTASCAEFRRATKHITRLLIQAAINLGWVRYSKEENVATPTREPVGGIRLREDDIMTVSIVRAGESMEGPVLKIFPEARIGMILIQRDEETATPHLYYIKLPSCKAPPQILLLDPMLGTAGSSTMAIRCLLESKQCEAEEENIVFLNIVSCPEGVERLLATYPKVRVVSACLDRCLNHRAYALPGLGDFGDRYFGTN
ncbi:hypothetical protein FOZ61_010542 [Perkinsus olseni]|uniref:uracil phosphoribosyltransferase n=1 Tax=Perkinsus olseni TaxID=32597 RepID=A0A7J6KXQ0_PEROL|nr:hypothetical protein FOZ61_010542 [Perkinsus olseni]